MKNLKSFALSAFLLLSLLTSGCGNASSMISSLESSGAVSSSPITTISLESVSSAMVSRVSDDTRTMNIMSVKKTYTYTDTSETMPIEQVADVLVKQMLQDLSKPDDSNRTFYITS